LSSVEARKNLVHLIQTLDLSQRGTDFTTDRIALEIPSDVLSDVSASMIFAFKKLDQQVSMTSKRVGNLTETGLNRIDGGVGIWVSKVLVEGCLEVTE
jgi:hypothetical protein